jgi:hypothetical protein
MSIPVSDALIKIIGVFAFDTKRINSTLLAQGYSTMQLVDLPKKIIDRGKKDIDDAINKTRTNFKNTYYSEFRDFMYTGKDQRDVDGFQKYQIRTFHRKKALASTFRLKRFDFESKKLVDHTISLESRSQEIYLFPGDIGIFALNLHVQNKTLEYVSDLINQARSFESIIGEHSETIQFHQWVTNEVICGIPLVGDKLELDEYSGSKFKVYSVIDLPPASENLQYDRDHLLYEIGTSSPIGVVGNEHRLRPSESYYDDLMQHKISAFLNYEGLALLDSFTVIGNSNYSSLNDESENYIPHHIWNRVYFGIYVYNLFVRYSLFKFNAQFLSNPVKYRDEFQDFLNHYNFKHISFNFLPNLIFDRVRAAMSIEEEIDTFEKRLGSLATSIQEQQEKRQAFLLTLISVISAIDAVEGILAGLNQVQERLGWGNIPFYSTLSILLLVAGYFLLGYLFPLLAQKLKRRIHSFSQKLVGKNG